MTTNIYEAPITRHRQINKIKLPFISGISISVSIFLALSLLIVPIVAQEDTPPEKASMEAIQLDPLQKNAETEVVKQDTIPEKKGTKTSQEETLTENSDNKAVQKDSLPKKIDNTQSELYNIAKGNRKVRSYGWGEYRVGGRCLCCDNKNDGDCIVVHTIERTNRLRISQIVHNGKIEGDTTKASYFGNLNKRDRKDPVSTIMADFSLGKMYEIRKVIVYTMINKEKHTNFLSNCELGYYDQFNRLQWTGKVKSKKFDEPITFEMENPVLTRKIMLRVKGGKSRITEVSIFCEKKKDEI